MKLSIVKGKASLDFSSIRLRPKHEYYLKHMSLSDAVKYLESLSGTCHRQLSPYRKKVWTKDKLKEKEPESVLKAFLTQFDTGSSVTHKPLKGSASDFIGVEIECFIPRDSFESSYETCQRCDGTGILNEEDECSRCDGSGEVETRPSVRSALGSILSESRIKWVSVKGDGSISADAGCEAVEVTVLTRLSDLSNLEKTCNVLGALNARVNKSTGLHIHLDSRGLTSDQVTALGKKFGKTLPLLASMVPKSRRDNSYCKLAVSKLSGKRYFAVNLTAFQRYNTVEIRLHSGTTDFTKIKHWITLLNAIRTSEPIKARSIESLSHLQDFAFIPEDTLEYCQQRIDRFSGLSSSQASQDQDSTDNLAVAA